MVRRLLNRPETLLTLTFAGLILSGAILLGLPFAHAAEPVGWLDALFTSTSAVCVTGLTTVDPATRFSRPGQAVVLALIQFGGLGILTFSVFAVQLLRVRVSFCSTAALQDAFFQTELRGDLGRALRYIFASTLVIELVGALLLYAGLSSVDPGRDWFKASFLAISAFCNAGFSVYSDNLVNASASPLVGFTIMALIVLGGLGYTVLTEFGSRLVRRVRGERGAPVVWSLNSRVVLWVSGLLILMGTAALLAAGLTADQTSFSGRVYHALFQSITARTCGYNSIDIGALGVPALMVLIALMFIGGSPGSCAGGIKTTSAAIWGARVSTQLSGQADITLLGRRVPEDVIQRATQVVAVASLWCAAGILFLSVTELAGTHTRLEHIIFEQVSAFGTVGLSAGLTPKLSPAGKLWIIASMFVGRLGPLTIALAILPRPRAPYSYPSERVLIG